MGDGMMCGSNRPPDVETLQLVQIVIRSDRSELEDLVEGCFDTCRLGVVEHVGHDYPQLIIPVKSINFPAPLGSLTRRP